MDQLISQPSIHLWTPGLFDFKGGIQVYSGFLLQALLRLYPHACCQTFVMHDRDSRQNRSNYLPNQALLFSENTQSHTRFHYCGGVPAPVRTAAFAGQLLSAGLWKAPNLILTTHVNFTPLAYRLKRLKGTPYWAVAHGFEAWDIQRSSVREALTHADRILAVSHYTRERLLQQLEIDPNRVVVLPNTFDADRFRIADKPTHLLQRYQLTPNQPIILTVNRLAAGEEFHSYDQILAALPYIRKTLPKVHYLIVGKGDDRPRLERLIDRLQLQDCVTLVGFVSDAELPDYYNLCDLFAMPSKLEGFGIVYLEAMASGKPAVGGQDGAMDALGQGKFGAIVNPDDVTEIATTLTQILTQTHPNLLMHCPYRLRETVVQTFGFERFQQTLAALMQDAFEQSSDLSMLNSPPLLPQQS